MTCPFSSEGWLESRLRRTRKVGIIRAHLEEDAGKMLHDEQGTGKTAVDLNRAGTPLLEIVSKPELTSPERGTHLPRRNAPAHARAGRVRLLRDQEGGQPLSDDVDIMFPDPDGAIAATPIVRIKNLNSFRFLERAVALEARNWQ